ncbi:flippase [Candidatus Wolfebacteria bacterium]|nr:flippase [Candidatus Wolfebacteria bacterium]
MLSRLKSFLFENKGTRQTVTKNVFWLSVSHIGSRLIRAIIIIYAARVLGAAEYGVFSYVLSFAGFFTVFADIGVNSLLTRDVASHPGERARHFAASFWIKAALLALTTLLIIFVAPKLTNIKEAAVLIPLVAFLTLFDNIREFVLSYFRGLQKMEWEAFIVTIMNVAIVIAGFIILYFFKTAKALLLSYFASVGLAALLSIFILRSQFAGIFRYFDKKLIWRTFTFCWPIAFSGTLGFFMLNTDLVMLGWWRTPAEIGYYSASQRIVQIFYILPSLLASAIFPTLSRFVGQGEKEKAKILNEKSFTLAFLVGIPLILGSIILGKPIIELVFGKEYLAGVLSFQILITTLFFIFPGALLGNLVLAHNKQRRAVNYQLIGATGNIVFNWFLIPSYGMAGSAVATLIAQALNIGLTWNFLLKIDSFYILPHLKKIIAAAALMGISSFLFSQAGLNIIINIITSVIIYFGLLFLLKEKVLKEIKLLFNNLNSAVV